MTDSFRFVIGFAIIFISIGEGVKVQKFFGPHDESASPKPYLPPVVEFKETKPATAPPSASQAYYQRKMSVSGIVKRTRSIDLDGGKYE